MKEKLNIGIIGCSRIAKNSTIPAILKSDHANLEFIGSRNFDKAAVFSKEFNCKKFGTYEEVLNDENVDAVYISTPVGTHEEWVIKSANMGKHILCEKSSTTSYESAKTMTETCKQNNVRLLECLMFRFHPSHQKVKEFINNDSLGKIFSFYGKYGFPTIPKNDIRYDKSLGGGILNDAGCYPICASRILFNSEPEGVFCELSIDKESKVDTKASIFMNFGNSRTSHSVVGYDLFYESMYSLWGSSGSLHLTRAYNVPIDMPVNLTLNNNYKNTLTINPVDHFELMINSFVDEVVNQGISAFNFEDDLLKQAQIMDAARLSFKEERFVKVNEIF